VRSVRRSILVLLLVGSPSARGHAAELLTLERALDIARDRAPALLAAQERIEEARGRLEGASVLLRENPVFEVLGGPSYSDRGRSHDLDLDVRQEFELGGHRRARIEGAQAGVERETAGVENERRQLLREVAVAFGRALGADEWRRLLAHATDVAAELLRTAERRLSAGEVALLDVNAARVAASRARADGRAAEAEQAERLGQLRALLGLEPAETIVLRGSLRHHPSYELDALLARAADRADLRVLAAEVREADAEVRLGEARRWPDVGLRVGYRQEEGADIPLSGLSLTLPLFVHGQEERATGSARARRARLALDAARRATEAEVRAAFEAYQRELEAVDELERNALPVLDESERLAVRSYELGQISLPDLLLVRREVAEARMAHVTHQTDAAVARVELESRAGMLR
jgi:cobalt-zinc-cadmium efflux system outer membrane protein